MFADISGFTAMSEKLAERGSEVKKLKITQKGPELLAKALNAYMELLSQKVGQSGGDIFKFAGDAMIILWTPPREEKVDSLQILCVNSPVIKSSRSKPCRRPLTSRPASAT